MKRHFTLIAAGIALLFAQEASAQRVDWKLGPLHRAAFANDTIALANWLGKGKDVNEQAANGVTPLHIAAFEGKKEAVQLLIEHGANPNTKDKKGRTALDLAFARNHLEIAGILIPLTDNGAEKRGAPHAP